MHAQVAVQGGDARRWGACAQVHASLIVVLTRGGSTARLVAKYRPSIPVLTVAVPVLTTDSLTWSCSGAPSRLAALIQCAGCACGSREWRAPRSADLGCVMCPRVACKPWNPIASQGGQFQEGRPERDERPLGTGEAPARQCLVTRGLLPLLAEGSARATDSDTTDEILQASIEYSKVNSPRTAPHLWACLLL